MAVIRFVASLILGLLAGIPVVLGLAIESAVIAWFVDLILQTVDFGTIFLWVFAIQVAPVALFGVLGIVIKSIEVAVDGWEAVGGS
jgi:hypothetical protein